MRKPPLQDVIVKPSAPHRSPSHSPQREQAAAAPMRRRPMHKEVHQPEPVREHTSQHHEPPHERAPHNPFERVRLDEDNKRPFWPILATVIGIVMIGTAFTLSLMFSGATITAYPKQDTLVADVSLNASVGGMGMGVSVELVALEQTAVRDVVALSEETVQERARGTITIFNEYSTSPQRLITQTRFMDDEGRIYRIQQPVEVPGRSEDGTPGSLTATVVAEEPGEGYNRNPGSFSVPGFVDRPQEGKIYARSTEDFTGGFDGIRREVNETDRLAATQELEGQLRDELLARLATNEQAPEGYQLFPGSAFFEFNALPDETVKEDKVRVSLSGTLHAIAYPKEALARALAQNLIGSYSGSPIRIDNIEELTISATAAPMQSTTEEAEKESEGASEPLRQPWNADGFEVQVTGKAQFVWEFDTEALRESLAGLPKHDLEGGMSDELRTAYPGIDYVHTTSRPFWKSSLPTDVEDITVTVKLDG